MHIELIEKLKSFIFKKPSHQFWFLQLCFWFFLSIISIFTLTLWYSQLNFAYLSHTFLQSFIGLILSLPLFSALMRIWDYPLGKRLFYSISLMLIIAFLWTVTRIYTFMMITGENNVWSDFGGWYFGSIFIYFCWTGLFYGIRYYQLLQQEHKLVLQTIAKSKAEQLERMTAQKIARDAQIKMLRYQLNPHFLCNTLNAINSLIETEQASKAQKMTVQLSKFLRYSLDNNPDTKIELENEINVMNLYLEIEKTRFGERLQLDFQISEQAKTAFVPSLLLQPLIENSMKHVIAQNENGGTIRLIAHVEEQKLVLELSDSGVENSAERIKMKSANGRGIGLKNISDRLQVLYGDRYAFDLVIVKNNALKTTIKIPFEAVLIN
jgi:sensor histidine kinase YesM